MKEALSHSRALGNSSAIVGAASRLISTHYTSGKFATQLRKLKADNLACGADITGTVTHDHVVVFLTSEVVDRENASHTLPEVYSNLRSAVTAGGEYKWGITGAEDKSLHQLISRLRELYPSEIHRAPPVRQGLLRRIEGALRPLLTKGDAWACQFWCIITLAHQTMSRLHELLDGNLTTRHLMLTLDPDTGEVDGVRLKLSLRKTSKHVDDPEKCYTYATKRDDVFDAVGPLRRHLRNMGLTAGKGDTPVFRRLLKNGSVATVKGKEVDRYVKDTWVNHLRRFILEGALRMPEDEAELFQGHGFRAGGLVDHLLEGMPWQMAAKIGGWSPNSTVQHQYCRLDATDITRLHKRYLAKHRASQDA